MRRPGDSWQPCSECSHISEVSREPGQTCYCDCLCSFLSGPLLSGFPQPSRLFLWLLCPSGNRLTTQRKTKSAFRLHSTFPVKWLCFSNLARGLNIAPKQGHVGWTLAAGGPVSVDQIPYLRARRRVVTRRKIFWAGETTYRKIVVQKYRTSLLTLRLPFLTGRALVLCSWLAMIVSLFIEVSWLYACLWTMAFGFLTHCLCQFLEFFRSYGWQFSFSFFFSSLLDIHFSIFPEWKYF